MPAFAARAAVSSVFANLIGITPARPNPADQREMPRLEAALTAEAVSAGHTYQVQIRNISTGGLTLAFSGNPKLFKGEQLLIRAQGFAPISGCIRWIAENECGVRFNLALAEGTLDDVSALFDPGKRRRPGRAKVALPAVLRASGQKQNVIINNISSGGAEVAGALPVAFVVSGGVMLEIDDLRPIGGYIRWKRQGHCGLMFSRLLPLCTPAA